MGLASLCRAVTELTKGGGEKENERGERETELCGGMGKSSGAVAFGRKVP